MVGGGITKYGLSIRKAYLCVFCGLGVTVNSILCVRCGKLIYGRCAEINRVTLMFLKYFACSMDGLLGEAVKYDETLCDEVELVREFPYLADRVIAGGGCEAAVLL